MNDNGKQSSDWKMIIGGILLIVVLFAGIKFIFWSLGEVIGHKDLDQNVTFTQSAAASHLPESERRAEAPSYCVHCGRELPESFEWGQFCPYCGEKIEQ